MLCVNAGVYLNRNIILAECTQHVSAHILKNNCLAET